MSTTPGPAPSEPPEPFEFSAGGISRVFVGPQGLRAGWSIVLAYSLYYFFRLVLGSLFFTANLVDDNSGLTPGSTVLLELIPFFAMVGAGLLMALFEQRRLFDYNLSGPRPIPYFFSGCAAGFAALSLLVGALRLGGWLHFGAPALTAAAAFRYALLWACAFLLVGCVEEGIFRGYLQFTFTRGLNFWWALAAQCLICLYAFASVRPEAPAIYLLSLLGVIPCYALHRKVAACKDGASFWQAAWVTSTLFGVIHAFNGGENPVGILAAGCIGFVFCVSVRLTGSAWWAIGCHAAWDWSETFFYGTADSGLVPHNHLLTTSPAGNPLLSGAADGPEGSLLALGAVAFLLLLLIALYGRPKPVAPAHRELAAD
jgi:hypothetical protein